MIRLKGVELATNMLVKVGVLIGEQRQMLLPTAIISLYYFNAGRRSCWAVPHLDFSRNTEPRHWRLNFVEAGEQRLRDVALELR